MRLVLVLLLTSALTACASAPRYGVSSPVPTERLSSRYGAVAVALATLPAYADGEEIYLRQADGAITAYGPLWADDPGRAVTMQLARDLGAISGALVAPDPWPFRDFPDAKVDVRIEDFLATDAGTFILSGQYFVAPETGGRNRARRFAIVVPVAQPATASTIVSARGVAVSQLALDIATNGLR